MRVPSRLASAAALALLAACGLDGDPAKDTRPRGPLPRAENRGGTHVALLDYHQGPPCGGSSAISATGPGAPGPEFAATTVALACGSGGVWSASLTFGFSHPAPAASAYDFAVSEGGGVRHETGSVPCYLDTLPVQIDPIFGATVESPVTFSWARTGSLAPGALPYALEYTVYVLGDGQAARASVVDASSLTLPLPARPYEGWAVDVIGVGGHEPTSPFRCSARATRQEWFTVAP